MLEVRTSLRIQCCVTPCTRNTTYTTFTLNSVDPEIWFIGSVSFTHNHDGYTTTRRIWPLNHITMARGPSTAPRSPLYHV
jgi:hypothetical protein